MVGLVLIGCAGAEPAPSAGLLAGSCEPSALVAIPGGYLVGDNETAEKLFVFDAALAPRGFEALPFPIDDIEALAVDTGHRVVVGSHSRNKRGEVRPERHHLLDLATGVEVTLDLAGCPTCRAAEPRAPNDGGFNIEGAAIAGGDLLLGLRGPLVEGKAVLLRVALTGPTAGAVTESWNLDLGGGGIRELTPWKSGWLVVAGPVADHAVAHALWWLPALGAAPVDLAAPLPPSTEGLAVVDPHTVMTVQDGDGKNGICRTPGTFTRVSVDLP